MAPAATAPPFRRNELHLETGPKGVLPSIRAHEACPTALFKAPRMPWPHTEKVLMSPTGGLHASWIHVFRLNSASTPDHDESSEASAIGPRYNDITAFPRISRPCFWKTHASQFADGQPSRESHVPKRLLPLGSPNPASETKERRRLRLRRLEDRPRRSDACCESNPDRRRERER